MAEEQRTLTDGVVTLRPWRDDDAEQAVAGHDDEAALWLGMDPDARRTDLDHVDPTRTSFVVEAASEAVGFAEVQRTGAGTGQLRWGLYAAHRGQGHAARALRILVDWALTDVEQGGLGLQRIEARIDPRHQRAIRVATRSGLQREGELRLVRGMGTRADATSVVVYARLATDPPLSDPGSFRSLLNSFLPRKRAIGQVLITDPEGRVLMCQLTYKRDWDLPGGVVEVGESPQLAAVREVEEELGLAVPPGDLLLTDWLPPWGGWDDAVCLVFDGGTHDPGIVDSFVLQAREIRSARFLTLAQVDELAADFTARRIRSALAKNPPGYTESGRFRTSAP